MMGLKREEIMLMSKKWNVIYPSYINSVLKESEGRKIGKSRCVDNPTINEMSEVLTYLKLPHVVEVDKTYCKDILNSGRIRVMLKNENGTYISNIKRKKELLSTLGDLIPKLKSRANQTSYSSNTTAEEPKKKDKRKKKK